MSDERFYIGFLFRFFHLVVAPVIYHRAAHQHDSAIYDEYPDMYLHVIRMLYKDYLPVRNYIYSGHNWSWRFGWTILYRLSFPILSSGRSTSHIPSRRTSAFSAGIAIYDEYPDMYLHVIRMLYKDYLPVRNYIYSGRITAFHGLGDSDERFYIGFLFRFFHLVVAPVIYHRMDDLAGHAFSRYCYLRRISGYVPPCHPNAVQGLNDSI